MGKKINEKDIKALIPTVPLYDEGMYYKIYKDLLKGDLYLTRLLGVIIIVFPLFISVILYKRVGFSSITIALMGVLIIFVLVGLIVFIDGVIIVKEELKTISKSNSIGKIAFVDLMNNLLERDYPVIEGNDTYYLSGSLKEDGKFFKSRKYYIVRRYTKCNIISLIGLYVGGYRIHLSDMAYRIKRPQFNELLSLYEEDLVLWESKVSEIINR